MTFTIHPADVTDKTAQTIHLDIARSQFPSARTEAATLASSQARASRLSAGVSRTLDLCFVALAAPVAFPLIAALALVVKADDPSVSPFFVQTRYGKSGTPFNLVKLRTMVPDAEQRKAALVAQSDCTGAGFKVVNDPRITAPGRWLRKLYLDELPQILNVLRGDMAWVGPRANSFSPETYEPWMRRRLDVKPGITGTWQVMEKKPKDFATRCRIDIDYVESRSLWGDLRILVKTVRVSLIRPTGE